MQKLSQTLQTSYAAIELMTHPTATTYPIAFLNFSPLTCSEVYMTSIAGSTCNLHALFDHNDTACPTEIAVPKDLTRRIQQCEQCDVADFAAGPTHSEIEACKRRIDFSGMSRKHAILNLIARKGRRDGDAASRDAARNDAADTYRKADLLTSSSLLSGSDLGPLVDS
jgi:hypothetical protein